MGSLPERVNSLIDMEDHDNVEDRLEVREQKDNGQQNRKNIYPSLELLTGARKHWRDQLPG